MKKSLIVCWISNNDYPLFREWLEKYHSFFDEIIIHWDIMFRFPFYNAFIQSSLSHIPNIKFLDMVQRELGVDDWRHAATTEMLRHATGDWIISIEQDWFSKDWDRLLNASEQAMKNSDLFGWYNPTNFPYIHPAYFFIKREMLEKTRKDFSPHAEINGADHFAMITRDALDNGAKLIKLQDLGFVTDKLDPRETDCFHLGGVNQNYLDFDVRFQANAIHRPEIFSVYNHFSRKANVDQSPYFMSIMDKVSPRLVEMTQIDPELSDWRKFFI